MFAPIGILPLTQLCQRARLDCGFCLFPDKVWAVLDNRLFRFGCVCARAVAAIFLIALLQIGMARPVAAVQLAPGDDKTATPIKHLIIIIGENRTFDHLFGLYVPKPGQSVFNILSEGIVDADGKPGPNFAKAAQFAAIEAGGRYTIRLDHKQPYATLPLPGVSEGHGAPSDIDPPLSSPSLAATADVGLLPGDTGLVLTGATGLPSHKGIDTRVDNATHLPDGPYQLTGAKLPHDAYTGNPVHRFYQMWQELDCDAAHATAVNPSGCQADLFPWVEQTVSGDGALRPKGHDNHEGAVSMAFYNMAKGDAPYLKSLADQYTLSDNYHQAMMGGTGANHIAIGYADTLYYSDAAGRPAVPPAAEVENPNPQPGTNNFYANDGYGSLKTGKGGSYTDCADPTQPGVAPILAYLSALQPPIKANCQKGAYYLLNNYNPGYIGTGALDRRDNGSFTLPPVRTRHIGDALNAAGVSWRYYGESWTIYLQDPTDPLYCNICNPFLYATQTMTDKRQREIHLQDTTDLYSDIADGNLPAVSFVKPNTINDGHPGTSKVDLFESFTRKIVMALQAQPQLWKDSAILVTFDEGGGYWDSGYVQPLDFFGDGTRVPLIVVSPYATGGRVVHTYEDHVSIDKFIERNWHLKPLSARSRDNLPDPVADPSAPYVPTNRPAIGDLFDLFSFR